MEVMTVHSGQYRGQLQVLIDHDQRYLVRIVCSSRQATLGPKIHPHSMQEIPDISSKSVPYPLTSMEYGSRRHTGVSLLISGHQTLCLTWAFQIDNYNPRGLSWFKIQHSSNCFKLMARFGFWCRPHINKKPCRLVVFP